MATIYHGDMVADSLKAALAALKDTQPSLEPTRTRKGAGDWYGFQNTILQNGLAQWVDKPIKLELLKEIVTAKTRRISRRWAFEATDSLSMSSCIDLEAEIMAALHQDITADVDRSILKDIRDSSILMPRPMLFGNHNLVTNTDYDAMLCTDSNGITDQQKLENDADMAYWDAKIERKKKFIMDQLAELKDLEAKKSQLQNAIANNVGDTTDVMAESL